MKRILTTLMTVSLALGLGFVGLPSDGGATTTGVGSSGCCKQ